MPQKDAEAPNPLYTRNWKIMNLLAQKDPLAICIKLAQSKKNERENMKEERATGYSKRCIQNSKASGCRI